MVKEVAVVAIHGMGDTKPKFADSLFAELSKKLGTADLSKVHFDTVFFQDILQKNQNRVFKKMKKEEIDYIKLRRFLLFGFSDATGIERNATKPNSPYEQVQKKILETLERCRIALGSYEKPIIIIAHSLGCQVISNYIWDSQSTNPTQGVWKGKSPNDTAKDKFRRLKTIKALYTTGCNIPIFVAGFDENEVKAIKNNINGYNFKWENYYDEDDVLGWPLRPLSLSYKNTVKDFQINADGGFLGKLSIGWNPLSHLGYWTDSEFIKPLAKQIMLHIE